MKPSDTNHEDELDLSKNRAIGTDDNMDPPFATATRLDDSIRSDSIIVDAIIVSNVSDDNEGNFDSEANYAEGDGVITDVEEAMTTTSSHSAAVSNSSNNNDNNDLTESTVAAILPQQSNITQQVEAVHIDEAPRQHEQSRRSFPIEDAEEKKFFRELCCQHWKIIVALLLFFAIAVASGLGATFNKRTTDLSNDGSDKDIEDLDVSISPSTTRTPTFSPSCNSKWEPRNSLALAASYNEFLMSPDGSTVILTSVQQNGDSDIAAFFITTLDVDSDISLPAAVRSENLEISDMAFNMDGTRLVIGIWNTFNENDELGGALLLYERVDRIWIQRFQVFTGGGELGGVFSVATNDEGTVFAFLAGSYDNSIAASVQVYESTMDGTSDLKPVGQRIQRKSMNQNTLVGLSASGERLMVYTENEEVQVYNYDGSSWQLFGDPIAVHSNFVHSLEISQDGETFALFTSDANAQSHVYQWNGTIWAGTPLAGSRRSGAHLHYGSLSADGRTLVLATAFTDNASQGDAIVLSIYERVAMRWSYVDDTLTLSTGKLVGISIDATGKKIVAMSTLLLQIFERFCVNSSLSPAPSIAFDTTVAPKCLDDFVPQDFKGYPISNTDFEVEDFNNTDYASLAVEPSAEPAANFSFLSNIAPVGDSLTAANITLFNEDGNVRDTGNTSSFNGTQGSFGDMQIVETRNSAIASDGSTLVVADVDASLGTYYIDTYNLTNSSDIGTRLTFVLPIVSLAISGDGQRLVFGTQLEAKLASGRFDAGGDFHMYKRDGQGWIEELKVPTGGGSGGGVFSTAITDDGNTMAFAASGPNSTAFVAVYGVRSGGTFLLLGNTLVDDWIDSDTEVSIVVKRLTVSSSDGLIRAFDLVDNSWEQAGQSVSHFQSAFLAAPLNPSYLVILHASYPLDIREFRDSYWQPLDSRGMNDYSETEALTSVATSADGSELMLTHVVIDSLIFLQPYYTAKLFSRKNDSFTMIQEIQFNISGHIQETQLTTNGNFIVVTDANLVIYKRKSCS